MFPFDLEDEELNLSVPEHKEPADYEIDFKTGRLTGRIITGLDAIKQWVQLVLSTDRYYFPQYTWNHGAELNTLIGKNYDEEYIQSEVRRMIKDALMVNKDIIDVEDIRHVMEKDTLTVSFTINTIYGRGEISV